MKRSIITAFAVAWLVAGGYVGAGFEREAEAATFGPNTVVSVSVFYDDLAPYGRWVDTAPYGWCWAPDMAPAGWRPYSDGYWVYTDFGWAWVSDEPWGWATYHYGRWFDDPVYGWMWMPGTEWAPAWVAWRESPDWVGWAPLPPTASWSAWSGLRFEAVSVPAPSWCFTERRYMAEPVVRLAAVSRNATLLSRTRDATRFAVRSGRPVDEGISLAAFERQSGRRVQRLRIVDAVAPQRGHPTTDAAVAFFRPRVRREPGSMPLSRAVERRMREQPPAEGQTQRQAFEQRQGRPLRNPVIQRSDQGPPQHQQHAQRGRGPSEQQRAERGDQGDRKGRGKKNGRAD